MSDKALLVFSGGQETATCPACELRAKGWHAYAGDAA